MRGTSKDGGGDIARWRLSMLGQVGLADGGKSEGE